jgi:predicted polyphosphate/ATP-dependent NAD kinase
VVEVAAIVGIIANPLAGTDIRRLSSPAGHTSNAAKVGIIERVATAALAGGAQRVVIANDASGLGERVVSLVGGAVELLDEPPVGSRRDTIAAARWMWKHGCAAIVVLGGDGTCRDVAIGWPSAPLIALSTGTNNVYPESLDPVAAGTAAGLIASGVVPLDVVSATSKRLVVHAGDDEHIALVDVAILAGSSVGARAVIDAGSIRSVVAAISSPSASGLSSIAGRVAPLAADDPDGVVVRLGGDRRVRVPLVPGTFATIGVAEVERLRRGSNVGFDGPMVLAFDGERDVVVGEGTTVSITIDDGGPLRIDVDRALRLGAQRDAFDVQGESDGD